MVKRFGVVWVALLWGCGPGAKEPVAPSASADTAAAGEDDTEECPIAARKAAEEAKKASETPILMAKGEGVQDLAGLFAKGASGFPETKAADDAGCFTTVGLSGKGLDDYDSLSKACGSGTGMKAFTAKVTGKLDAASHPRDTYSFTMLGGFCYRMFAVGDASLENLSLRIHRPNGALLSLVSTKHNVVILDPKEPWCKKTDRPFHIVVETKDKSAGSYAFGIWARPSGS